jgi:hypothetical protein
MNCSQQQENWKSFFFLTTRDIRCVHHGWHGTHRYKGQILATHASTWVHRYSSLLQWSVPLGQRGHVAVVARIPGLWHITKEKNHRAWCQGTSRATATVVDHFHTRALSTVLVTLCSRADELHSGSERDFHLAGIWTLVCFETVLFYGFPVINYCNPGVYYESPVYVTNYKQR